MGEGCCGGEEGVGEAGEGGGAGPFAVFFEDLLEADALGLDEAVEVADVVCAAGWLLVLVRGWVLCCVSAMGSVQFLAKCQVPPSVFVRFHWQLNNALGHLNCP